MSVYAPPQGKVCYIHTDPDLIVIDKPAELLSVPGRGPEKADCAISRVQADYPEALTVGQARSGIRHYRPAARPGLAQPSAPES